MARETLPTYLSLEQAVEITDQSVKTIRRRISDGSLPAYRFGPRHIRVKLDDLQALAPDPLGSQAPMMATRSATCPLLET